LTTENINAILLLIVLLSGLGLLGIIFWLLRVTSQSRVSGRVGTFVGQASEFQRTREAPKVSGMTIRLEQFEGLRGRINEALAMLSSFKLQSRISSAYWPITDIEFILIQWLGTILGFFLGWLVSRNIVGGIGLGVLLYFVPNLLLDRAIIARRKKFGEQLLDFLVLVTGGVQAGYGLPQSLDLAVGQSVPPASEEFGRVLREVKFGFGLDQALMNLSDRMQNDDLMLVVTAIIINSQVGGNLSLVLSSAIETIRERLRLFGEVRSLTAYARFVGNFISLLPVIAALLIYLVNPGYFETLGTSIITQIIFVLAIIGVIIGNIVIRQIVKIKV